MESEACQIKQNWIIIVITARITRKDTRLQSLVGYVLIYKKISLCKFFWQEDGKAVGYSNWNEVLCIINTQ